MIARSELSIWQRGAGAGIMTELSLEFLDEQVVGHCDCCGHETRAFAAFAYRDGAACAAYKVAYTVNHSEFISMLVSLGVWGDGTTPEDRRAVAITVRTADGTCRVDDADTSYWRGASIFGAMLTREEAFATGCSQAAFDVYDAACLNDARLRRLFGVEREDDDAGASHSHET
ncbi:hypothetical protein CHELA1G11_10455 [Hyphomicrobiales bacterium]|nr:hypothetical protein CHELA1G11_10455 [Hyphomicrobiales bacterium]CAH1674555.1 hypothetical protein CHELA1G2_13849 [Hyphomicrobiales bacterium]